MTDPFRETEERLRRLVEGAQDLIYDCDAHGNFTYVNPASARHLNRRADELLGRHFLTLIRPDHRKEAGEFYARQLRDRTLNTYFEFPAVSKDGRTLWIGQHVQLVYEGTRIVGFQAIARDITRQKAVEEQLRHAQKIDAVGKLAAGIAHDFNNLLTTIMGYTELTLTRGSLDDESRRDLLEVRRNGERASALTRQLLTFARKQVRAPEDVDLNQIAADTMAMLSGLLPENIQVVCDFAAEPARIKIDPAEIAQALINLALNARDAMPEGGRLGIAISRAHLSPAIGSPSGGQVQVQVTDNGVGMPDDVRERIFEPFFTTKEQGQGTGLGLSFVYGIVDESKGFISVESAPGKGTTVTMRFPALAASPLPAPPLAAPPPSAAVVTQPPRQAGRTILLVDDEDSVRTIASRLLDRSGFRVLAASGPGEACALFELHRAEIDLLLIDVVMPEMNGQSLAERLTGSQPALPVLFMSGYSDVDAGDLSGRSHCGFLSKPFTAAALTTAVNKILTRD